MPVPPYVYMVFNPSSFAVEVNSLDFTPAICFVVWNPVGRPRAKIKHPDLRLWDVDSLESSANLQIWDLIS